MIGDGSSRQGDPGQLGRPGRRLDASYGLNEILVAERLVAVGHRVLREIRVPQAEQADEHYLSANRVHPASATRLPRVGGRELMHSERDVLGFPVRPRNPAHRIVRQALDLARGVAGNGLAEILLAQRSPAAPQHVIASLVRLLAP